MKATVLPKKQLKHVLTKQGFADDGAGDLCNAEYGFMTITFDLCLKEIKITPVKEHEFFHYRDEESRILLNKNWFIPNSFKEDLNNA